MALSKRDFSVLKECFLHEGVLTQRELADSTGFSVGSVNDALKALAKEGYVCEGAVTEAGAQALEPYKVKNAIIMAAGMSSRFAPFSYERPKGVLKVKGEVLIERQIRQLQEAGIADITVVVGYLKEAFFYLEDKFNVKIVVNEEYATRNNNSTLMLVRDQLSNTYVCSSDDYFVKNVFEPYVYHAYYAAAFFPGETDEYCITTGPRDRIVKVVCGGCDSYAMMGHVYFDRAFSDTFVQILEEEYDRTETYGKLWEDIYIEHLDVLDMTMLPYEDGVIYEFDSLNDLRDFDRDFIYNVDSAIIDNICVTLNCDRGAISNIVPIKKGLTNLSFRFNCGDDVYVYRHPGVNSTAVVDRAAETASEEIAQKLGIDDTYLHEDPQQGWKISRYVPDSQRLDYNNAQQVYQAMGLLRKLHGGGECTPFVFDVFQKADRGIQYLKENRFAPLHEEFDQLYEGIKRLAEEVAADGVEPCLCHNNAYDHNFLVKDGYMALIDWEYSAMSDYASDLGTFICCSDYSLEQAKNVISCYFDRTPTAEEERHCLAYVALCSYYWFVWALFLEHRGDSAGKWLYRWYRCAKTFLGIALPLYEGEGR